jgi:energy-coupling factor transporter ATP-binding protein EcfA2
MRARDNPFRTQRLHRLAYRAPDFEWQALLDRLGALRGRGVLLGPCGSGKSTLLRQLAGRLEARGLAARHQRLDPDDPARAHRQARRMAAGAGPGIALLVDGADRLPAWRWWMLRWQARHAAVLVATTHRPGRLPTLRRCATDPSLLRRLVAELDPGERLHEAEARRLLAAHGGNLRDVFWALYDRRAALDRPDGAQATR